MVLELKREEFKLHLEAFEDFLRPAAGRPHRPSPRVPNTLILEMQAHSSANAVLENAEWRTPVAVASVARVAILLRNLHRCDHTCHTALAY